MGPLLKEGGVGTATADAVVAIGLRLELRRDELADRIVTAIREEIADYRLAEEKLLTTDVRSITVQHLDLVVRALTGGRAPTEADFAATRAGGARRVHQGISLESFQRAARLWGRLLWEAVLEDSNTDIPAEREAALHIAGRVMEHVDQMSTNVAEGFLNELQSVWSDREVVRRDLLDGLVSGQGDSERIRRLARSLKLRLADRYVVVVLRGPEALVEEQADQALAARVALRRIVEAARRHLRINGHPLLVGMRDGEVVALCPIEEPGDVDEIRRRAGVLAADLEPADVSVGVSGGHAKIADVAAAYAEARDAVEIAVGIGIRGRALHFDEVLIDHMVRSSPHGDRILDSTLRPLLDYDAGKQAELVSTLRAYMDSGFNLTRSAEVLQVHPNTVVYRLRRIRELSGRDPHDPNDLLLLFLGLKLSELRAQP
ncbi:MAG: helix-turn-helix domain-containing protein [Actinomycetota bacterium]|nr:helix-turn-helix domain-containing protein [Actinomycetota bacterium]